MHVPSCSARCCHHWLRRALCASLAKTSQRLKPPQPSSSPCLSETAQRCPPKMSHKPHSKGLSASPAYTGGAQIMSTLSSDACSDALLFSRFSSDCFSSAATSSAYSNTWDRVPHYQVKQQRTEPVHVAARPLHKRAAKMLAMMCTIQSVSPPSASTHAADKPAGGEAVSSYRKACAESRWTARGCREDAGRKA